MIRKAIIIGCGEQSPLHIVLKVMLFERVLKEAVSIAINKEIKV
jgi:hypothetical protein